jgi:hypothetical protein
MSETSKTNSMKVTVKEKTENEIDFSVKGQLLISTDGLGVIVLTNGEYNQIVFNGVALNKPDGCPIPIGVLHDDWTKNLFKKFNGTITIEQ